MSEESIITTTDKIDYIFAYIRKEEKRYRNKMIVKWIIRLLLIWYIIYVYLYLWPIAKDFYTMFFSKQETTQGQTQSTSWTLQQPEEIQIWNLKINKEKADQIRALFCK